jgi:hypothetical protein
VYIDPRTEAAIAGRVQLAPAKLHVFKRELPLWHRFFLKGLTSTGYFRDHVALGAANPAVVVQIEPKLLIAAYSSDHDAVAMLAFSPSVLRRHKLAVGDRLLSVNTYTQQFDSRGEPSRTVAPDLAPGPYGSGNNWFNFWPVIAEFVARDISAADRTKDTLPMQEWDRALRLGPEYHARYGNFWRDGNPYLSEIPARTRD